MVIATTKSARRVMEILELFDRCRRPLSLKEVCQELDYPMSSTAALLKSLVALGYLEYDKLSRTYLPTMRIAVMGSWVEGSLLSRIGIIPIMERLRDESRQTVFLGTRSDLHAQYVHVLRAEEQPRFLIPPGTLRPLARSGIGLLFLSLLSDRDLEHTLRRVNAAEPDLSQRIDFAEVKARTAGLAQRGYVFRQNLFHSDGSVIAMLLPVAPFNRTFAIGLGGNTEYLAQHLDVFLTCSGKRSARCRRHPPLTRKTRDRCDRLHACGTRRSALLP